MEHKRNILLVARLSLAVVALMLSVGFVFAGTPQKSTPAKRSTQVLRTSAAPNIVLYDQYDNPAGNAWLSDTYDVVQGADDFVVPAGETWTIGEVDVQGATLVFLQELSTCLSTQMQADFPVLQFPPD